MPRTSYTVKKKLEILELVEKNNNLDQTARDLKINRRTLQKWRKDKPKLLQEATKRSGALSRRVCTGSRGHYTLLEKQLTAYIKERRKKR